MSWSVNIDATPPAEFSSAVYHAEPPQHLSDAQRKQLACARQQAVSAASSPCFKDAPALSANLSGHGAGEKPKPGDHVAVRITICEEPKE